MSGVEFEKLMTPAEVAAFFGVDPRTVTRWAKSGKLSAVRTLGGAEPRDCTLTAIQLGQPTTY